MISWGTGIVPRIWTLPVFGYESINAQSKNEGSKI
jgi:hypothetical protein